MSATTWTAGPTEGSGPIETYLAELRRGLPRGRAGRDLLTELRDGLEDAAEAYRSVGLPPAEAERRAVAEFGDAEQISALCRNEVGRASGLRAAVAVIVGYLLLLGCWRLYYEAFGPVSQWDSGEAGGTAFTVVDGIAVLIAAATALWLRRRARSSAGSQRPVVLAFAGLTWGSIVATGVLAVITRNEVPTDQIGRLACTAVQLLSVLLMALMALQVTASALRVGLRREISSL